MTSDHPVAGDGGRSASAGRRRAVLAVLGLALLTLVSAVPVWLRTAGTSVLEGDVAVTVTGTQAAPGVPAAALVLLAAGVAAGLAGRVGRWVVVAAVLLAGVLATASALAVVTDPAPAARTAVAATTGVETLAAPVTLAPWPWLATAVGVLVVLAGGRLAVTSRRWARPSVRHDVPRDTAGAAHPAGTTGAAGMRGAGPGGSADPAPDDDRAAWDALTRGDDPT